jgi:hypothetical protein
VATDDPKAVALAMVTLKYAADRIAPTQKALRAHAGNLLDAKDRITAVVDGVPVGTVTKAAPKPVVSVVWELFGPWMAEHWPERVERGWSVDPAHVDTAIAVLREHAPELLAQTEHVAPWALSEVVKLSEEAGRPVGPGGELDVPGIVVTVPEGSVSVRIEAGAGEVIAELWRSGRIALDGTVRTELPGGAP